MTGTMAPAIVRVLRQVTRDERTGCWLWMGHCNQEGYGSILGDSGSLERVHRVAYEALLRTAIPDGLVLDHLCRVRNCVNPEHLDPVLPRENVQRARPWMRHEACKNGHPFTPDNLLPSALAQGKRRCLVCNRRQQREWTRAKRAQKQAALQLGEE